MLENDCLIVEGRMAPFLKCGFSKVNILVRAKKHIVIERLKARLDYSGNTDREIADLLNDRLLEEKRHYKALHGIEDHFDENCFDIMIDTSELPPMKVLRIALSKLKTFSAKKKPTCI